jgi:hypothetical protein
MEGVRTSDSGVGGGMDEHTQFWVAVITAAGTQVTIIAGMVIQYLKTHDTNERVKQIATEATTVAMEHATAIAKQDVKLEKVVANVQKIELATNSMKDALVDSTAKQSQAVGELKGAEDERTRQKNREDK